MKIKELTSYRAVIETDDIQILMAWNPGYEDQGKATAYKIAAADEMYEALKELRIDANRLCDRCLGGTYEDDCRRSIDKADDAIAKAKGK